MSSSFKLEVKQQSVVQVIELFGELVRLSGVSADDLVFMTGNFHCELEETHGKEGKNEGWCTFPSVAGTVKSIRQPWVTRCTLGCSLSSFASPSDFRSVRVSGAIALTLPAPMGDNRLGLAQLASMRAAGIDVTEEEKDPTPDEEIALNTTMSAAAAASSWAPPTSGFGSWSSGPAVGPAFGLTSERPPAAKQSASKRSSSTTAVAAAAAAAAVVTSDSMDVVMGGSQGQKSSAASQKKFVRVRRGKNEMKTISTSSMSAADTSMVSSIVSFDDMRAPAPSEDELKRIEMARTADQKVYDSMMKAVNEIDFRKLPPQLHEKRPSRQLVEDSIHQQMTSLRCFTSGMKELPVDRIIPLMEYLGSPINRLEFDRMEIYTDDDILFITNISHMANGMRIYHLYSARHTFQPTLITDFGGDSTHPIDRYIEDSTILAVLIRPNGMMRQPTFVIHHKAYFRSEFRKTVKGNITVRDNRPPDEDEERDAILGESDKPDKNGDMIGHNEDDEEDGDEGEDDDDDPMFNAPEPGRPLDDDDLDDADDEPKKSTFGFGMTSSFLSAPLSKSALAWGGGRGGGPKNDSLSHIETKQTSSSQKTSSSAAATSAAAAAAVPFGASAAVAATDVTMGGGNDDVRGMPIRAPRPLPAPSTPHVIASSPFPSPVLSSTVSMSMTPLIPGSWGMSSGSGGSGRGWPMMSPPAPPPTARAPLTPAAAAAAMGPTAMDI